MRYSRYICGTPQGLGKTVQLLALVVTAPPSAQEAEDALENAERSTRNAEEVARQTLAGTTAAAAAVAGAAGADAGADGVPRSDSGKDLTMGMLESICQLMPVGVGCCDSSGCWLSTLCTEQDAHRSSFWLKGVCAHHEQVDSGCSSVCHSAG